MSYILVVVDLFSSMLFGQALRDKSPQSVKKGFGIIFGEMYKKPEKLMTDGGGEFCSKSMNTFYTKENIYHVIKYGKNKCAHAEAYIRFIKEKLSTVLEDRDTKNWPKYLQSVIKNLNSTPKRRTGLRPLGLTPFDDPLVRSRLPEGGHPQGTFEKQEKMQLTHESSNSPYQKGARVFFVGEKATFQTTKKGKVYEISDVLANTRPILIKLKDIKTGKEEGRYFYKQELSIVSPETVTKKLYEIEKILNTRKRKNVKQYLVKFKGIKKLEVSIYLLCNQ